MDDKRERVREGERDKREWEARRRTETVEMAECVSPILVRYGKLRGKCTGCRALPQYAYGRIRKIRN